MLLLHPSRMYSDRTRSLRSYGRYLMVILPLFTIMALTGSATVQLLHTLNVQASDDHQFMPLSGTLSPLVAQSIQTGVPSANERIRLSLGLQPRHLSALLRYADDVSDPHSPLYHHFLTPQHYTELFGADPALYDGLSTLLRTAGFTITHDYSHRLLLNFSGTRSQVERFFHLQFATYKTPDGRSYVSHTSSPLLPARFAREIISINGLSDATRWRRATPTYRPLPDIQLSSQASTCPARSSDYLLPDQVASAYHFDDLYKAGYKGAGQTIALFELAPFAPGDLQEYLRCFGQSKATIEKITVGSSPVVDDGGGLETELDAELILSAAPHLARLKIYEAGNNIVDYLAQWAQIVQDAVPIASTSWGLCEQQLEPATIQQEHILFASAVAQGQSIFAASGDMGSAGCYYNNDPTTKGLSALDPSTQPYVTSVGGSALTLTTTDQYVKETTWNESAPGQTLSSGASGGGISQYWSAPAWQHAPGVRNSYSSSQTCQTASTAICREVPDVALHAHTTPGYPIYCSTLIVGCGPNPWTTIGGTSASTPLWAAVAALMNEQALKTGGFNLGFLNPLLYQLAQTPADYARNFHDISEGNNDLNSFNSGAYPATSGYDLATGLGSPNAYTLANSLVALGLEAMGKRRGPDANSWYFPAGNAGGSFDTTLTLQNGHALNDAQVDITYVFEQKKAVTIAHTVKKSSRLDIHINDDLHLTARSLQQAVATIVQVRSGSPGIVAERTSMGSVKTIHGISGLLGATQPAQNFYFPQVDTRTTGRSYHSEIALLNPNHSATARITLIYYNGKCGRSGQPPCLQQDVRLKPLQRATVTPAHLVPNQQVALKITANSPIVAEHTTYLQDKITTAGGFVTGVTSVIGAPQLSKRWLFAEGYTGHNFQHTLILTNFSTRRITTRITLQYENGHTQQVAVSLAAMARQTLDINKVNVRPVGKCDVTPCKTTAGSALVVDADAPIVAERLLYFHYGTVKYTGASAAMGEVGSASHNTYAFAGGSSAPEHYQYLALQNPSEKKTTATITLFTGDTILQQRVNLPAHSRHTLNINQWVIPLVQAYPKLASYRTWILVQAEAEATIVAERIQYSREGGYSIIGFGA